MDEVSSEADIPAPSDRGGRWHALRELRRQANRDRSAGEWLDWCITSLTTTGTYFLIGLGFSASYSTIRQIAVDKGDFSDRMSHIVPISFEGGIIILSLHVIKEARQGRRALMLRLLVALGAVATLITNSKAKSEGIEGALTHVVPVAMFIICFEYLVHSARKKGLEDRGLLPPPLASLRGVEWALDPINAFARWRLMALHGISSPEQAMWVRQSLLIKKAELKNEYGNWRSVPTHIRLKSRTEILAEGERRFSNAAGIYSTLANELSRPTPMIPAQSTGSLAATPRRELENPDTQTSLPPGTATAEVPLSDVPYVIDSEGPLPTISAPQTVETRSEREQREHLELSNRREDNYHAAVEVVLEYMSIGREVTGPSVAEDHRVGVGARTVQRYFPRMQEEGILPVQTTGLQNDS